MAIEFAALLFAFLAAFFFLRLYFESRRVKEIPGTFGWILPDFFASLRWGDLYLKEKNRKFGYRFNAVFVGLPTVVLGGNAEDTEWFRWGEKSHNLVPGWPRHFQRLLGRGGVILSKEAAHRRYRNTIVAALLPRAIKSHISSIDKIAKKGYEPTSEYQNTLTLSRWITLRVFLEVAGFDTTESHLKEISGLLEIWAGGLSAIPIALPGMKLSRALKARKRLIDLIATHELKKEAREDSLLHRLRSPEVGSHKGENGEEDSPFSDEELLNNLLVIEFAGQDTTSSLLSRVTCLLAAPQNKSILLNLQQAIAEVFPEEREFLATDYDALLSIDYLWAVFTETTRLGSPINGIIRKVGPKGTKLPDGLELKSGTYVMWNLMTEHLKEDIFPEATQFRPERWLSKEDGVWVRNKHLRDEHLHSFGGGERLCPGRMLAELEFNIVLIRLVGKPGTLLELEGSIQEIHFPIRTQVGRFKRTT